MAKYGTKKYWQEELNKDIIQLDMLCNGFTRLFAEHKSIAIDDVREMINRLWMASNRVEVDSKQIEEASEEEDDE